MDKYLDSIYLQEEFSRINEFDLSKLTSKIPTEDKAKSIVKQLNSSVNVKKPKQTMDKIKKATSGMPKVQSSALDNFLAKKVKNYKSMKSTSVKIIENSLPGISSKMSDKAGTFIAFSSMFSKKGDNISPKDNMKKNIKEFVIKVRKFADDFGDDSSTEKKTGGGFQKEDIPDIAVAFTIVVMAVALATSLASGMYAIMTAFATLISPMTIVLIILTLAVILMATS
jgi:hypothetical protein